MKKMKIGYFADGPWAHQTFAKLLKDETLEIAFVCARNDSPDPVLQGEAAKNGLNFIVHPKINAPDFIEMIRQYECDLFVSMSFNQIFRSELLNLPRLKTINCHAGKLPFYRGRNVLNWVLINDESEFGITVHYVDDGIDTGDILVQSCHPISDADTYETLLLRAYEGCATTLYEAIKSIQTNSAVPVAQNSIHPLGFYCSARKHGDELIDWNQKSREVFNFVRAICEPGPKAKTFFGDVEIKINRVEYLEAAPSYKGIPGSVVGINHGTFIVKTFDSFVRVLEWRSTYQPKVGDRLK